MPVNVPTRARIACKAWVLVIICISHKRIGMKARRHHWVPADCDHFPKLGHKGLMSGHRQDHLFLLWMLFAVLHVAFHCPKYQSSSHKYSVDYQVLLCAML